MLIIRLLISQSASQRVSLFGLVLILYAIFAFDRETPSPSLYTLLPTIGASLILVFANSKNVVGKILGTKLFVGIGLISYSTYLWHQPLLAFARLRSFHELSIEVLTLIIMSSLILGYLSWKYIEQPFRNKQKISRKRLFSMSIVLTLSFVIIGLVGYMNIGFPSRLKNTSIDLLSEDSEYVNIPRINNGWCFYSIASIKNISIGNEGVQCSVGAKTNPKLKGILFGDSFAGSYEPFWNEVGIRNNYQINSVSTNWCYPSFNKSFKGPLNNRAYKQCLFNREFFKKNYKNYDFIILAGMWSDIIDKNQMNGVLDLIEEISKDSKLVIVMPQPKHYDINPFNNNLKQLLFDSNYNIKNHVQNKDISALRANEILLKVSLNHSNLIFLDRETIFNGDEISDEGLPLSADGSHLSIYGSKFIFDKFAKRIEYESLIKRIEK